jgi:hypothetical protein
LAYAPKEFSYFDKTQRIIWSHICQFCLWNLRPLFCQARVRIFTEISISGIQIQMQYSINLVDIAVLGATFNFTELAPKELGAAVAIFSIPILYICLICFKDIRFYYRNGWDFSKNSGFNLHHGFFPTGNEKSRISNKVRIFCGYPFFVGVLTIPFFLSAFELFRKL